MATRRSASHRRFESARYWWRTTAGWGHSGASVDRCLGMPPSLSPSIARPSPPSSIYTRDALRSFPTATTRTGLHVAVARLFDRGIGVPFSARPSRLILGRLKVFQLHFYRTQEPGRDRSVEHAMIDAQTQVHDR